MRAADGASLHTGKKKKEHRTQAHMPVHYNPQNVCHQLLRLLSIPKNVFVSFGGRFSSKQQITGNMSHSTSNKMSLKKLRER